jgi:hypothetical protein
MVSSYQPFDVLLGRPNAGHQARLKAGVKRTL